MGPPQLLHRESLRGLGAPELCAIGSVLNHAGGIHPLDRVGHRRGGDHGLAGQHSLSATGNQIRIHQAAGAVVDENRLGNLRQGRQAIAHRLLPAGTPRDPDDGAIRPGRRHQRLNLQLIHRLTDDPDPADHRRGQDRVQGPGQHRPACYLQQQLVPLGPHPATAAGTGDQQMHSQQPPAV